MNLWVSSAAWLTDLCSVIYIFLPFVFPITIFLKPNLFRSLSQRIPALTSECDTMTSLSCHSSRMGLRAQWQHLLCSMETERGGVMAMPCESQLCYWSPFSAWGYGYTSAFSFQKRVTFATATSVVYTTLAFSDLRKQRLSKTPLLRPNSHTIRPK